MSDKSIGEGVKILKHSSHHEITFHSPKANSLTSKVIKDLIQAFCKARDDKEISFIHLKSTGNAAFCAGASFDELKQHNSLEGLTRYFKLIAELYASMLELDKIIFTSVQGKTVGGGVGILAASDYTIALDTSEIKLSELSVGLAPFIIGPLIERKTGTAKLLDLSLSADWVTAGWANQAGIYSQVISGEENFNQAILKNITKFSAYYRGALILWKKRLWSSNSNWKELLASRAEDSAKAWFESQASSQQL